jgi:transcriptional regulator with XRE-family HTH domain
MPVNVISKRLADELGEKRMRDAYLAAQTRTKLVNQIRAIRTQRGWSQGDFAKRLGKPQSNISRLENREYGNFTLKTLLELANIFDCGLVVEFAPYEEFLLRTHDLAAGVLEVPQFHSAALQPLTEDLVTFGMYSPGNAPFGAGTLLLGNTSSVGVTLPSGNALSLGAFGWASPPPDWTRTASLTNAPNLSSFSGSIVFSGVAGYASGGLITETSGASTVVTAINQSGVLVPPVAFGGLNVR